MHPMINPMMFSQVTESCIIPSLVLYNISSTEVSNSINMPVNFQLCTQHHTYTEQFTILCKTFCTPVPAALDLHILTHVGLRWSD